ncbi:MAG: hypothetical protein J5812_01495 [Candidatus Methanomethylophilaceae archaeon]|nr:hypothetical protein [Candidatus Methanomethylophilaceae archaeon]MBR3410157.1 hypothetical protein [Candidatus Methanomethylophilaceae archaeon]MBR4182037.1 hypothetical protein [Candidatus Methanomethylophilaceae archaeon]
MGSIERRGSEVPAYRKVLKGTFDRIDMDEAIRSAREAVSEGKASEKDLCNVLLCSDDPGHHAEALELARKNIDQFWGRLWLFKMYFNGIAVERDVKAALHILYSDNPIIKSGNGAEL